MSESDDRRRALIAVGAVLSFLAMAASLVVGSRLTEPRGTGADSYSKGPLGHQVALELLDRLGYQIARQHQAYHYTDTTLYIAPHGDEASTEFGALWLDDVLDERTEYELASIVVLPKWRFDGTGTVLEVDHRVGQVASAVAYGAEVVWSRQGERSTEPIIHEETGTLGEYSLALPWRQSIVVPDGFESLLGPDESSLVAISNDQTRMIVADPDIFHNFNIQRADNAALVDAIVGSTIRGDAAAVDEVFHGHASVRSLGEALGEFPAVLLVVQGILLCLLAFAFGFVRFGVPRPEVVQWEHGPLEPVHVSANVLALGQSPNVVAAEYARRAVHECADALGVEGLDLHARATGLDRVMTERGLEPAAQETLREAARLSDVGDAQQGLSLARSAYALRRSLRGHVGLTGEESGT